jgi:hypothetical protein
MSFIRSREMFRLELRVKKVSLRGKKWRVFLRTHILISSWIDSKKLILKKDLI